VYVYIKAYICICIHLHSSCVVSVNVLKFMSAPRQKWLLTGVDHILHSGCRCTRTRNLHKHKVVCYPWSVADVFTYTSMFPLASVRVFAHYTSLMPRASKSDTLLQLTYGVALVTVSLTRYTDVNLAVNFVLHLLRTILDFSSHSTTLPTNLPSSPSSAYAQYMYVGNDSH